MRQRVRHARCPNTHPRYTLARASLASVALFSLAALTGCPAPPIDDDDAATWDAAPYDAQPTNPIQRIPQGAPSCAPEAIIDLNARGTRTGRDIRLMVDTRNARDDVRTFCATPDSREVILRYTTPPASQGTVVAVRVTTVSTNTTYDTVLGLRGTCTPETVMRDITCSNDAWYDDGRESRGSTVYNVGLPPEETFYIQVDGADGASGAAELTLTEIPELGLADTPCILLTPEQILIESNRTAPFRCPHAGLRCQPGAAADGTDMCLRVLPVGSPCDFEQRRNLCERPEDGVECARNPRMSAETRCALPGTAPGARCRGARGSADRCDAGLACSEGLTIYDRDECVVLRAQGETCDPARRGAIDRCGEGLACCAAAADAGAETYCVPASTNPCYTPPE